MTRLLRLLLLAAALLGMVAGSTAMAMAPLGGPAQTQPMAGHMAKPMAMMDCMGLTADKSHGSLPCKKMTLQCMAAMGCLATAAVDPGSYRLERLLFADVPPSSALARRLSSRSPIPDPDPPSLLI